MMIRSHILFPLLISVIGILPAIPPGQKTIADFGFHQTPQGRWITGNGLAALALANPDHFEDVVIIEGQILAVYLNLGNGFFSAAPNARLQLPERARQLTTRRSERMEALATIRCENGQEQEFNLSRLFAHPVRETQSAYRPHNLSGDSLHFQPVWSWTFPYNWGSWPVTAGDIDNDGRVEIISSMTHPDSIQVGWLIILENDGDNNYREDLIIPLNFHSWVHQIKITDWDQDGNLELTCAVGFRIRIWEFYGDKNYQYFDTNISFGGMVGCAGIEVVDSDQNNQLELLTIFNKHDGPWRSLLARYEFVGKNPPYFTFSNVVTKLSGGMFYSFAAGDMDNDGLIDILPGYAQLGGPGPVTMYNEEFDPVQMQFIPRYFTYPYSVVQSYNLIDDLDGDSHNEVFITGVGNGYGGILYMKSDAPDNYQVLSVDTTLYNADGSSVNVSWINEEKHVVKAASHIDYNQNTITYYVSVLKRQLDNSFQELWAGPQHDPETYLHSFAVLDSDGDSKENIIYKISTPVRSLNDLEKTTITSIDDSSPGVTKEFILHQNYPNPFNPETTISFDAPAAARVSIHIYDIQGRLIKEFPQLPARPGLNRVVWDGTNDAESLVASGVYFYRLVVTLPFGVSHHYRGKGGRGDVQTRKMVLIR